MPDSLVPEGDSFELGKAVGQHEACALIGGHCSAAQAAALTRLRASKRYRKFTQRWRDFCPAQVRISADTYRALEPSIKEGALHLNGEAILSEFRKIAASKCELTLNRVSANLQALEMEQGIH